MPLFEYLCEDCGTTFEILMTSSDAKPSCTACGSAKLRKLLSAHSSMSGSAGHSLPGPGDTTCCGSAPGHGSCAGPGSCCGKN